MADTDRPPGAAAHPKGTLATLLLYALSFAGGFLALYFLAFLERGAPHP